MSFTTTRTRSYATKKTVFCKLQFEGFHRWPDAPSIVDFLRSTHRHIFHVTAVRSVRHGDRDIEFILLKRQILDSIEKQKVHRETETWSCEHWAQWLIDTHSLDSVIVSEDDENGAILSRIDEDGESPC